MPLRFIPEQLPVSTVRHDVVDLYRLSHDAEFVTATHHRHKPVRPVTAERMAGQEECPPSFPAPVVAPFSGRSSTLFKAPRAFLTRTVPNERSTTTRAWAKWRRRHGVSSLCGRKTSICHFVMTKFRGQFTKSCAPLGYRFDASRSSRTRRTSTRANTRRPPASRVHGRTPRLANCRVDPSLIPRILAARLTVTCSLSTDVACCIDPSSPVSSSTEVS